MTMTVLLVCAYIAGMALSVKLLRWMVPDPAFRDSDAAPLVLCIALFWPATVPAVALFRLIWKAATWKPKPKPDPLKRLDRDIRVLEEMKRQVDQIGR